MQLLRFSVANHRSISDEVTLDLAPRLGNRTAPKGSDSWDDVISPAVAILGANASGKSNLLDALVYALEAVRSSATTWLAYQRIPRTPHRGFTRGDSEPTEVTLDFLLEEIRYSYFFSLDDHRVIEETLHWVPSQRWSQCFRRVTEESGDVRIDWNTSFLKAAEHKRLGSLNPRELVLSAGVRAREPRLAELVRELTSAVGFTRHSELVQRAGVDRLIDSIRQDRFSLDQATQLVQAADVGITRVTLEEERIPQEVLQKIQKLRSVFDEDDDKESPGGPEDLTDEDLEDVAYNLRFSHQGADGEFILRLADESEGTISWLATAPMALGVLREGGVLIADEIDASMHVALFEAVLSAFADPEINRRGAQLIFTTHNTNLLEHLQELEFAPEQIWFAEKDSKGGSIFYPLSDFSTPKDANFERRYLAGRYGALPRPNLSVVRRLVAEGITEEES